MGAESWKEILRDKMDPDWAEEIDQVDSQVALRKLGKLDEKGFAATRLRRGGPAPGPSPRADKQRSGVVRAQTGGGQAGLSGSFWSVKPRPEGLVEFFLCKPEKQIS